MKWVSYDDATSLKAKMQYANSKCIGGAMVWAASTDDANGTAIEALTQASGRNNFTSARLKRSTSAANVAGQCVWGEYG